MISKDGTQILEGQFCHGKVTGYGRNIIGIGYSFGEMKESKLNGLGTSVAILSSSYVGAFKDGMFHGRGKLTLLDGTTKEGEWAQGILQEWS